MRTQRRKYKNDEINRYQAELEEGWERLHYLGTHGGLSINDVIELAVQIEHAAQWKGWNMGYCAGKGVEWR